jgi:ornithine cyclodeaminase/alanine dehydrogenase-like protein (mu-crystallin family)
VLLFDLLGNQPLALFDANELTRLRTAAITTLVAAKVVAPGVRKLALFGAGLQGRGQAESLCDAPEGAITVFKSVGVGLADVATALLAYRRS